MRRVAILGAGICGLTAAFFRRADAAGGDETWLLEAAPVAGGCVRSRVEDGLVLEEGPSTLRTSPEAERLLTDLQLWGETIPADPRAPRFVVRGGRTCAIAPGPAAVFTPLLSWKEKWRALGERKVPRRPADLEDESVASFFSRRFGEGVARAAAGAFVSGVYAGDPEALSMRSAFPKVWDAEERFGSVLRGAFRGPRSGHRPKTLGFRKGLSGFVEALRERVAERGVTVRLGTRVDGIEGPLPAPGPPFRVRLDDGTSLDVDRILSTLPPAELARLLGDRLKRSGDRLRGLRSAPVAVVNLAWATAPGAAAPEGFGILIPKGEGFRSLGVLHPSALFPSRFPPGSVVTTSFLGGILDPDVLAHADAEIVSIAEAEVRRLHPSIGARRGAWLRRWPAAIPQPPLGHHATLTALDADLAEINRAVDPRGGLLVTGPWRDGLSLGERIARGEACGRRL